MMRRAIAIVALGIALPGSALAGKAVRPLEQESYQDQTRCAALAQQFNQAAAQQAVADEAKQQASQGAVLCRAGRYGEGADTLEKAVRMIGLTPGK
jgi:hypothetical protein